MTIWCFHDFVMRIPNLQNTCSIFFYLKIGRYLSTRYVYIWSPLLWLQQRLYSGQIHKKVSEFCENYINSMGWWFVINIVRCLIALWEIKEIHLKCAKTITFSVQNFFWIVVVLHKGMQLPSLSEIVIKTSKTMKKFNSNLVDTEISN